jgi:hypothetical protein
MAHRKTVTLQPVAGATIRLAKPQLGFNPADTLRNFQVSTSGLDGGTFTVSFVPANSRHEIVYQADATESAAVIFNVDFLYDVLLISFDNLGANADPEVSVTFWQRGL